MTAAVKEVRALVVSVDGTVRDERLPDLLATWQKVVGGDIEGVYVGPAAVVYCNESGLLDGLPANPVAAAVVARLNPRMAPTLAVYGLRGDVVFLGVTPGGNSADCPRAIADLIEHVAASSL